MYIGEIILKYRNSFKPKMSQRAFASRTSLSPSYINTLEKVFNPKTGKPYTVTTDVASDLANAMNISIEELLKMLNKDQEFELNTTNSFVVEDFYTKQAFPLLGTVKAGYDYLAAENVIGYVSVDNKIADIENCYALRVVGDSMQPVLYEDDIIIIHKQNDVESGQTAIILINDEVTVKKVVKYDNYIELIAFNSYYPPKKLTDKDNFKIIGKVIEGRISKIFE